MRTTRTTVALTSVLAGVLVATGTGPAGAAGDGVALTKPQAKAIANAGVVMRQDLPANSFTPPRSESEPDRKEEAAFYRCLGVAQPTYLARNSGLKFIRGDDIGTPDAWTLEVDSQADVADSTSDAVKDQLNMRTAKAVSCYREKLTRALSRNLRGAPKAVAVELVQAAVAGADEAWAYKLSFTVASMGEDVSGNGYVVGSRVGQALLSVLYTGTGKEYTLDEVTTVAAKPVARAKQATPASKAKAARSKAGPKG